MSASNEPTHTIRLRAAWRIEGRSATRKFNRPTNLGGERVRLVWDGRISAARLNEAPLEPASPIDVTDSLRSHNALVIDTDDPSVLATVRLEIGSA